MNFKLTKKQSTKVTSGKNKKMYPNNKRKIYNVNLCSIIVTLMPNRSDFLRSYQKLSDNAKYWLLLVIMIGAILKFSY